MGRGTVSCLRRAVSASRWNLTVIASPPGDVLIAHPPRARRNRVQVPHRALRRLQRRRASEDVFDQPDRGGLLVVQLYPGGQGGDLLFEVGDALRLGGHQAPASSSGSASRAARQAASSASAARYRSIRLAEGSAMTAAVRRVARA